MMLALQLVSYFHADKIGPLLTSLQRQTVHDWVLFVRDQSESQQEADVLRSVLEAARIPYELETGNNVGFGAGHNRLFMRHRAPFIACVNPDVIYADNTIECALNYFETMEIAAIQPLIWRTDGVCQSKTIIDTTGFEFRAIGDIRDRYAGRSVFVVPEEGWVFGPTGTNPFFRRSALLAAASTHGAPFDERFFLYREDIELAIRLARAGQRAWFAPGVELFHTRTVRGASGLWRRFLDEWHRSPVVRVNSYAAQWGIYLMHGTARMSIRAWARTLWAETGRTVGLVLSPSLLIRAWRQIFNRWSSYLASRKTYQRWTVFTPHSDL